MKGFLSSDAISECLKSSSRVFKAMWALEVSAESLLGACACAGHWRAGESPLDKETMLAANTQTNHGVGCVGNGWVQVTEENVKLVQRIGQGFVLGTEWSPYIHVRKLRE